MSRCETFNFTTGEISTLKVLSETSEPGIFSFLQKAAHNVTLHADIVPRMDVGKKFSVIKQHI